MNRFQSLKLPLGIIIGGVVIVFAIMATKSEPKANPNAFSDPVKTKVSVQKAITQTASLSAKSQGTVVAKREIDIVAQVSGKVVEVSSSFVDGQFVDRNEVLIKIDDRDHQARLRSAQSRVVQKQRILAEEKGRVRQAKREWRDLGNKEANDLFLRKPQLAEAQAELESAQADLDIAKLNIERTEIRLPFDARVKETLVNLGQFVGVGTRIASVYDTATAEVRLPLSDRQMALLDLPVSARALTSMPNVRLSGVIAGKAHQWQGKITRTEASVDVRSRMYYAVAEVEQPFSEQHSAPLLPGLFVEARIDGKRLEDVLVLPKETLVKRTHLYTLDGNNKIQLSPITVLSKDAENVWLRTDLSEDTAVLLEKHALVSPGLEIEPIFSSDQSQGVETQNANSSTVVKSENLAALKKENSKEGSEL